MASPEPSDLLEPAEADGELGRLGHYRVLDELGRGGMGFVFRAEDTKLKRLVALKVMNQKIAATPNARKRFLTEARAMAAVRHDNLVTIFEVGQRGETPFMAMEMLAGGTLEQFTRSGRRLGYQDVIRYAKQMADGLAAAHSRGIIHRDIKPANIWIEENNDRIKILDFGLALAQTNTDTMAGRGSVVGTPGYLSPEQARSEPLDDRSDLYSLGAVLYELATGKLPLHHKTVHEQLIAILTEKPAPASEVNPDIPEPLSRLIAVMLRKEPRGRIASASELSRRLDEVEVECERTSENALAIEKLKSSLSSSLSSAGGSSILDVGSSGTMPAVLPAGPTDLSSLPDFGIAAGSPGGVKRVEVPPSVRRPAATPQPSPAGSPLVVYGALLGGFALIAIGLIGSTIYFGSQPGGGATLVLSEEEARQFNTSTTSATPSPTTGPTSPATTTAPTPTGPTTTGPTTTPPRPTPSRPTPPRISSPVQNIGGSPAAAGGGTATGSTDAPSGNRPDGSSTDPVGAFDSSVAYRRPDPRPWRASGVSEPDPSLSTVSTSANRPNDPLPTSNPPPPADGDDSDDGKPSRWVTVTTSQGGADATVVRGNNTPRGDDPILSIRGDDAGDQQHSYLRFDLDQLGVPTDDVRDAQLVIYPLSSRWPSGAELRLYGVEDSLDWPESQIRWANSFSRNNLTELQSLSTVKVGDDASAIIRVGGKELARFIRNRRGPLTLVLAGRWDNRQLRFGSRERDPRKAPVLGLKVPD